MTDESPWGWLLIGVAVSVVAGFAIGLGIASDRDGFRLAGYVLAGVGGLLVQVSIIALGVSMGTKHARR